MARGVRRRGACGTGTGEGARATSHSHPVVAGRLPRRPHAHADERAEEIGADGQARALGDGVDAGGDLETTAGADDLREQFSERLARAFDARRNNAGRDHGRLEQAEVVFREVKDVAQRADVGRRAEIDGCQAQHRLIDDPQPCADRRAWSGIAAMDAEIDGDVDDLGALGEIHAEEENVGPRRVRQVHAHGGQFAEDRESAVGAALEQLGPDAERLVGRMAHAEHPLVAAHGADAAADLVGQRLEGEPMIGRGQGGAEPVARTLRLLVGEEGVDGLLETAVEKLLKAVERDEG